MAAGESLDSPYIQRGVRFLLQKQNANGGWGETYLSCVNKIYSPDGSGSYGEDGSGVVQVLSEWRKSEYGILLLCMSCTVLYFTVLYCTVLYYTVL